MVCQVLFTYSMVEFSVHRHVYFQWLNSATLPEIVRLCVCVYEGLFVAIRFFHSLWGHSISIFYSATVCAVSPIVHTIPCECVWSWRLDSIRETKLQFNKILHRFSRDNIQIILIQHVSDESIKIISTKPIVYDFRFWVNKTQNLS